jgi:hypothetical protein
MFTSSLFRENYNNNDTVNLFMQRFLLLRLYHVFLHQIMKQKHNQQKKFFQNNSQIILLNVSQM